MIDLTFLDEAVNDNSQNEINQLLDIADKIGSYDWSYKDDPNGEVHLGPTAQELQQVPGLESCVVQNPETGVLEVNTQFVALATLGLVAALARVVLKDKYIRTGDLDGIELPKSNNELGTELSASTSETATRKTATGIQN